MPPDQERINEVRAWLVKAGRDLRMARLAQTATPPLRDQAVYHAQQAAEKAMKGFLSWHDRPFRKTHNLVEIGEPCAAIDSSLESLLRRAAGLTEYGWKYRYPDEPAEPSEAETSEAISLADEVFGAICTRLPASVRP